MIKLHRLNGSEFYLNPDHIELIEKTPNSVITLTNGHKYVVSETVDEIIDRIIEFKGAIVVRNKVFIEGVND